MIEKMLKYLERVLRFPDSPERWESLNADFLPLLIAVKAAVTKTINEILERSE